MTEELYFTDIAQIRVINDLLRIDTRRDRIENIDSVGLHQKVACESFGIEIEMPVDSELEFRFVSSTQRLLVVLLEELGKHSKQEVRITVDSFMQRCALVNRGSIRQQLKIDLQSLAAIRFDMVTKDKKLIRSCKLCEVAELKTNGIIYVKFSEEVVTEWKNNLGLMQLPYLYFQLNRNHYQLAPSLLYYISFMRHLGRNDLRIESLLAVTVLPAVDDVRATKNGGIRQRIINRFFRELHALDAELKFKFTRYGKPISEAAVKKLRYEDLIDILVRFEWIHQNQLRPHGKSVTAVCSQCEK